MNLLQEKKRLYYIDWLRVLAVVLLFPFHTGEIYSPRDFYVKSETMSQIFTTINSFIYQWHMPLFLFLAGIGTYYALEHRTGSGYIKERFKRLFVPLIFGILIIIPPQAYLRMFGNPSKVWPNGFQHNAPATGYDDSFFQFYPDFFNGIFPNGNLEWGHLWFLAYLFTFSLIAVPLFLYLKKKRGRKILNAIAVFSNKRYGIFIFFIPIAIFEVALRWRFPGLQNLIADWANFLTYITIFIYGYVIVSDGRFLEAIDREWKPALAIAIFTSIILTGAFINGINGDTINTSMYIAGMIIRGLGIWCWLIALLGIARKLLNKGGRFISYGAEAALPFYILHQTAVLIIGYYVLQLQISIYVQYLLILMISLTATVIIYELLIRRFNLVRLFFGLKRKIPKVKPEEIMIHNNAHESLG